MTQIKIEVPANDHIALSAMADALQRIATERQHVDLTRSEMSSHLSKVEKMQEDVINKYENTTTEKEHDENMLADAELNDVESYAKTMKECYGDEEREAFEDTVNELHAKVDDAKVVVPAPLPDTCGALDADGIPHDNRIHSKGATRLADNTWRLRKRPADKTEEEWTAYIDSVKAELKAVQDIPSETTVTETVQLNEGVTTNDIVEALTGEPTLDEQAVADLTPPVIEESVISVEGMVLNGDVPIEPPVIDTDTPVAPVTPPTSLTPPVVDAPKVTTFQELMLYITSNAKKRGADNDMIKSVLLEIGGKRENGNPVIPAIPVLSTRQDLIPKFVTALEAKLS